MKCIEKKIHREIFAPRMGAQGGLRCAVIYYPFSLKKSQGNHSYQMWVRFFAQTEKRRHIWLEGESCALRVVGFHPPARDAEFITQFFQAKGRCAQFYSDHCSPRAAMFAAKSRGVGGFPSFGQRNSLVANGQGRHQSIERLFREV